MNPVLLVSPHLDDGVLSCGQFMAGRPEVQLVTVFAGRPPEPVCTEYDGNCGFESSTQAVNQRRWEDEQAAALLHARPVHLDYFDHQYRNGDSVSVDELAGSLLELLDPMADRTLIAPVGVAHPDHELTSDAAVLCLCDPTVELVLYEELPGRVLWPDQIAARLAVLNDVLAPLGGRLEHSFVGTGPLWMKQRAVALYGSQQWALDRRCLFVPERFHRVAACD